MTGKIFLKLIAGVFCLLLLALVTVDYFATNVAKDNYIQNLTGQLADKGRMLALTFAAPETLDADQVRRMAQAAGGRLTVVRADGKVLVDSEADASSMENHRTPTRPELLQAFRGEEGSDIRQSATIGVSFLYVAVPVAGGRSAIRIAFPLAEINRQVRQIRGKILVSTALAFLPAILIAALLARYDLAAAWRRSCRTPANWRAATSGRGCARPIRASSDNSRKRSTRPPENLQKTVAQLQHEHAELEKLERIRKDFVINVSHELRTPLASIQGYTETLIDGAIADPDYNMRFLGIIRHNAERLARLTEDLLTLSRVEQKRQKFEFEIHFVNALIHDAFEMMRPIAEKDRIELMEERAPAGYRGVLRQRGGFADSQQPDGECHQVHARGRTDFGGGAGARLDGGVFRARHRDRDSRGRPAAAVRALLPRG